MQRDHAELAAIRTRGFQEVNNRSGGNCFNCRAMRADDAAVLGQLAAIVKAPGAASTPKA